MLISVEYKNGHWQVDEQTAMLYREFRAILEGKNGVNAMAFIALACDPDSPNYEETPEEQEREAALNVFGNTESVLPEWNEARKKYVRLCNTPYYDAKRQLANALQEIAQILQTYKPSGQHLSIYLEDLKQLAALLVTADKIHQKKSGGKKEKKGINTNAKIKGDKDMGYSTRKYLEATS